MKERFHSGLLKNFAAKVEHKKKRSSHLAKMTVMAYSRDLIKTSLDQTKSIAKHNIIF